MSCVSFKASLNVQPKVGWGGLSWRKTPCIRSHFASWHPFLLDFTGETLSGLGPPKPGWGVQPFPKRRANDTQILGEVPYGTRRCLGQVWEAVSGHCAAASVGLSWEKIKQKKQLGRLRVRKGYGAKKMELPFRGTQT